MTKVRDMQGVPAHVETLKAKDAKRHKARCKFSEHLGKRKYKCVCPNCGYFERECRSSSRCEYYEDKNKQNS